MAFINWLPRSPSGEMLFLIFLLIRCGKTIRSTECLLILYSRRIDWKFEVLRKADGAFLALALSSHAYKSESRMHLNSPWVVLIGRLGSERRVELGLGQRARRPLRPEAADAPRVKPSEGPPRDLSGCGAQSSKSPELAGFSNRVRLYHRGASQSPADACGLSAACSSAWKANSQTGAYSSARKHSRCPSRFQVELDQIFFRP